MPTPEVAASRVTEPAIHALDAALQELRGDQAPSRRKLRAFFAAVLQAADGNPRTHDGTLITELFSPSWSKDQKRLVAVALVHLLCVAPASFADARFIGKSEALWDEAIPDLYKQVGITVAVDSYEKRRALQDLVPRALQDLQTALEDFRGVTDGASLSRSRQHWRQRAERHRPVLGLFLPSELLRTRNDELFDAARSVLDSDDTKLVWAYQAAQDVTTRFKATAEEFGTELASGVFGRLADEVSAALERHKAKRVLEPAKLAVTTDHKRYPLHEAGRTIRLALRVSNAGKGPAIDARLVIEAASGLDTPAPELYLGTVGTGVQVAEVPVVVEPSEYEYQVLGTIAWRNVDGSVASQGFEGTLVAQNSELDWNALGRETPYLLTAIDKPSDLIGRDQLLGTLEGDVRAQSMSSCIITGQKRVGKTSIALSLQTLLNERYTDTIVAYLQIGRFRSSPKALYKGIAREIVRAANRLVATYPALAHLARPIFDDGFAEILDLLDDIADVSPELRVVLILDEFDELPSRLYQINDEAAAFFNTLRDVVAQHRRSLMLVGGERLNFVLTANGSALNLLSSHRVDDFRREDQYADFAALVTVPAKGVLEFEEGAVDRVFEESAGHPYFAKMICRSLYQQMTARRDASVTPSEIREAVVDALRNAGVTTFAHFWDDGIFESDPARIQGVALARRLALLSIGRALRSEDGATRAQIESEAKVVDLPLPELIQALSTLEQRRIVTAAGEQVTPRIPFFRRWLESYGPSEIVRDATDQVAQQRLAAHRDEAVIRPDELTELSKAWGLYRGRQVGSDDIRVWLDQFGGALNQRRALHVLKHLRFYGGLEIRNRMSDAHSRITAGWTRALRRGQQTFTDIVVVPLSEPGKSGWTYGSMYVVENKIHKQNVVALEGLAARLASTRRDLKAVVFVDDFVGTGTSAIERFGQLDPRATSRLRNGDVLAAFVVLAAFRDGVGRVESWLEEHKLPIQVYPYELLDDADRAFSDMSRLFDDASERGATRALFERIGSQISSQHPLGWDDGQALIVFESNVPNNTLPHIWLDAKGAQAWTPLFPRF